MYIGKIGSSDTGLNVNAINRSAAQRLEAVHGKKEEEQGKDIIIISPNGKKQSMMEQLLKRKEDIMKRRESMTASAAENGTDIKEQLEQYEKQLKEIDEQIAQLQTEPEEDKKNDGYGIAKQNQTPRTKEEIEAEQLNSVMQLSMNNERAEIISSVKNKNDGRINVLESEIKSGAGNIEAKIEEVSELTSKSRMLSADLGAVMNETNQGVMERNAKTAEEDPEVQPTVENRNAERMTASPEADTTASLSADTDSEKEE